MSNAETRSVFASNLNYYMKAHQKSRRDICAALGFSYYTFSDWCNGKKYPRMDKVEMLANYFGILKSDLIEEKDDAHKEVQQKNDTLADAVLRMRSDDEFLSIVETLNKLQPEQLASVKHLLNAFLK